MSHRRPARAAITTVAVVATLAALLWPASPVAGAAEDPAVARGVRQVDEGDFEGAVATLSAVADQLAAVRAPEASRACLYLGIAQLALDEREPALRRLRQALDLDPGLRLGPDRFSPKVIGALEEARHERDTAARAAAAGSAPTAKKGGGGRVLLLAGAGVAAGVGIAVLARGGPAAASGDVRFSGTRFASPAATCPDGAVGLPLGVSIEVDATNGSDRPATITSVSSSLIIVASPAVPAEVGFASTAATTVAPSQAPPGGVTLRLQTTLECDNGSGDAARYNEWSGRVTLVTAAGAVTLGTSDQLRVNLP